MGCLSSPDLLLINDLFSKSTLKKNEYFLGAGEKPDKFGIIISGLFRYFYIDKSGKEYTKYFARENNFLISYSSMILGEASRFYIESLGNSEIIIASFSQFNKQTENSLIWNKIIRKLIEQQYFEKEKREYQFLFDDAKTRYKSFLLEYPGLIDKVKHYYIASYLGISPVTLSRIRNK